MTSVKCQCHCFHCVALYQTTLKQKDHDGAGYVLHALPCILSCFYPWVLGMIHFQLLSYCLHHSLTSLSRPTAMYTPRRLIG